MKVAAIAALVVLIILAGDAGQNQRQNVSPVANCDNDGRCSALNATTQTSSGSEIKKTTTIAQHQQRPLDANGNPAGAVISGKTGARARVGIAYAARFQAYIDDSENNYGAHVLFMGGIGAAHVRFRANTHAEKP